MIDRRDKDLMMAAIHTVFHPDCDDPEYCITDIYTAEDIAEAIIAAAAAVPEGAWE